MIDYFALALTHGLIVLALLRIVTRPGLDREELDFEVAEVKSAEPTPREAMKARRARQPEEPRDA